MSCDLAEECLGVTYSGKFLSGENKASSYLNGEFSYQLRTAETIEHSFNWETSWTKSMCEHHEE